MTKKKLRIIFMGTPEFAVASLKTLIEGDYNIVCVVTSPDKPVGRHGSVKQPSAVKQFALQAVLPILQPEKLKDEGFLSDLKALKADIQIVVAFRMLPEAVWNMPTFGTFNLHASLLPQYRGAAPINWAIINGEKETGVTTFFINQNIDTGKIIFQRQTPVSETDDAGTVHDRLMTIGASLVKETVDQLINNNGTVTTVSQDTFYTDQNELKQAPKIFKDTCIIDWRQSADNVYNFIRGLSPYPTAWTTLTMIDGKTIDLKVFVSEKIYESHDLLPGTVRTDGNKRLKVAVIDGYISILYLQPAGKKRMTVKDFLNGYNIF